MKTMQSLSALICLYGLFILYVSTHELLHRWNTTKKFVAIKVFLVLLVYEELMIDKVVDKALHGHKSCFEDVGFNTPWETVEARWWIFWVISVQCIPMVLMLRAAFPASELFEEIDEHHTDFLQ